MAMAFPDGSDSRALSMDEQNVLARYTQHRLMGTGYASIQSTRPQTIGYGLVDSPTALAAWIFEKLAAWSDCGDDPESIFGRDAILDLTSLYWFTGTGASAARLYWESYASLKSARVSVSTGISLFPYELYQPPQRWVERCYNLVYWSRPQQGGHFAAWEQPEQFVKELWRFRSCLA
jgi:epoxide hydrolase